MGSKQPEHIHRDVPKTGSQTRTDDEHIHEEDKQLLHTRRGKLAIPKREENPELTTLRAKKRRRNAKG